MLHQLSPPWYSALRNAGRRDDPKVSHNVEDSNVIRLLGAGADQVLAIQTTDTVLTAYMQTLVNRYINLGVLSRRYCSKSAPINRICCISSHPLGIPRCSGGTPEAPPLRIRSCTSPTRIRPAALRWTPCAKLLICPSTP